MDKATFNIESRFQHYCRLCGLDLDTCPTAQVIEMRRAYYAGVGAVLLFLRNEVSDLTDDEIVAECVRTLDSCRSFFTRQAGLLTPGLGQTQKLDNEQS